MAYDSTPYHLVRPRLLRQIWHNRLMAAVATTSVALLVGFTVMRALPRGPATASQALIVMLVTLLVGSIAGFLMRSRWAFILVAVAYIAAVEIGQINTPGPTVGPVHLDSTFGILALMVGRGFHGLVAILPMLLGVSLGQIAARQIANEARPNGRRFKPILTIALSVMLVMLAGFIAWPAHTPAIKDADGMSVPGSIASLEKVRLGGQDQWIMLRGQSVDNPVLLYLSGGPGQSDLAFSRALFEDLTRDFVVVGWDQRGTGKSYAALDPAETLTLDQAIADTGELSRYLSDRFDEQKIYLMGESWGSLLGVLTVQQHPHLYHAFIGSGQMVNVQESDRRIYQALLQEAEQTGDRDLLKQLQRYGEPPYQDIPYANGFVMSQYPRLEKPYTLPQSYIQHGTAARLGPFNILGSEYSLVEKVNLFRGLIDMFTVMYPQLQAIDLRQGVQRLEVPVYILDGAAELPARRNLLLDWFDRLQAPKKELFTFENAAHSVAFEQFEALSEILTETVLPQTYPGAHAQRMGNTTRSLMPYFHCYIAV